MDLFFLSEDICLRLGTKGIIVKCIMSQYGHANFENNAANTANY